MSYALDPKETFSYVLSNHRDAENPKTFYFHYATVRENRRMTSLFQQADDATSIEQIAAKTIEGLQVILAGWENATNRAGELVAYNPAELDAVITDNDMTELRARVPAEMSLSELQKKSSALQSKSPLDAPESTAKESA